MKAQVVKKSKMESFFHFMLFLLPVLFVIFGAIFVYYGVFVRNNIIGTIDDIKTLAAKIQISFGGKYKNFNLDSLVLSETLPYSMKAQNTANTYSLKNRFGGLIFFYEAFNTQEERLLYFSLYNDQKKYKEIYPGVSSYIILFTGLSKTECQILACTDWSLHLPNFIGIEASYLSPNARYNGIYNLKTQLLSDVKEEPKKTEDLGIVSAKPMSKIMAKEACGCHSSNCTFAIKLR